MALTKEQKKVRVDEAQEVFTNAASVVFVTYDALSLADMNELRDSLFEEGISMRVIPKRLLRLAAKNSKIDIDATTYEGQVALVWGDDLVAPAKKLAEFAKKHDNLKLVSGVMDPASAKATAGKRRLVLSSDEVEKLASLPSREELLAKLVGTLAAPLTGTVGVLAGVPRSAVYVLKSIAESKGGDE